MSDQGPNPPRVAIKFGSSTSSTKKHTRPTNIRRHRAHALEDEESGGSSGSEDGENRPSGRHEVITDLDWSTPNRDVTDRKRQNGRSERDGKRQDDNKQQRNRDSRQDDDPSNGADAQENKPVKWGLTINMKGGARNSKNQKDEPRNQSRSEDSHPSSKPNRSIDDEALDALLGGSKPAKRKLSDDAPDREPELEDYRSVPIDDFGATLLRGFGWDGKMRGKVKEVTPRHANLAGLGAKNAKGAEELTSWNQKLAGPGGGGARKDSRPPRLEDYRREESKKRQRKEERHSDSYKRERERERERDRDHGRDR